MRPAPPPASAIVVEPKLSVVWKKPVTTTASHESGSSGRRCDDQLANSAAIASNVRWTLKTTGCAYASASFIASQLMPHSIVSTTSAT